MDYAKEVTRTAADRAAAAAVVGLGSLEDGSIKEFVLLSIAEVAAYDPDVLAEARSVRWLQTVESSLEFTVVSRRYAERPLAAGSKQRVLDLLREAEDGLSDRCG